MLTTLSLSSLTRQLTKYKQKCKGGGRTSRDERTTDHSQSQQPVVGATTTQHPSPTGLRDWANRIVVIRVYFSRSGRRDGPLAQVQHTRYPGSGPHHSPPVDQDWRARFARPFLSRDPSLIQACSLSNQPCECSKIYGSVLRSRVLPPEQMGLVQEQHTFIFFIRTQNRGKQLRLEKQRASSSSCSSSCSLDTGQCSIISSS